MLRQSGRNQTFSACGTQIRSSCGTAWGTTMSGSAFGRVRILVGHPPGVGIGWHDAFLPFVHIGDDLSILWTDTGDRSRRPVNAGEWLGLRRETVSDSSRAERKELRKALPGRPGSSARRARTNRRRTYPSVGCACRWRRASARGVLSMASTSRRRSAAVRFRRRSAAALRACPGVRLFGPGVGRPSEGGLRVRRLRVSALLDRPGLGLPSAPVRHDAELPAEPGDDLADRKFAGVLCVVVVLQPAVQLGQQVVTPVLLVDVELAGLGFDGLRGLYRLREDAPDEVAPPVPAVLVRHQPPSPGHPPRAGPSSAKVWRTS